MLRFNIYYNLESKNCEANTTFSRKFGECVGFINIKKVGNRDRVNELLEFEKFGGVKCRSITFSLSAVLTAKVSFASGS